MPAPLSYIVVWCREIEIGEKDVFRKPPVVDRPGVVAVVARRWRFRAAVRHCGCCGDGAFDGRPGTCDRRGSGDPACRRAGGVDEPWLVAQFHLRAATEGGSVQARRGSLVGGDRRQSAASPSQSPSAATAAAAYRCRSVGYKRILPPPTRRLCFHVYLFICLLAGLLEKYWSNRLDFEWPWPTSRSLEVKRSQLFWGDNSV